jgi:hypothetical protein
LRLHAPSLDGCVTDSEECFALAVSSGVPDDRAGYGTMGETCRIRFAPPDRLGIQQKIQARLTRAWTQISITI